jgi:hypothetical protein
MPHSISPNRATRRRLASNRANRYRERDPAAGKTVAQFCDEYDVSPATFYRWKLLGIAPAVLQPAGPGGWQLITPESEEVWKARRSALVPAE